MRSYCVSVKKILSTLILLSVFFVQVHGLFHLDIVSHDKNHHCEICEIVSHNPSISPTTLDLDISSKVVTVNLFPVFDELIVPRLVTLGSNSPRGHPVI